MLEYKPYANFKIFSEFIDSDYLEKIKSFAHENNATVNDVLIAVYSLVLSKQFNDEINLIPMKMAVDFRYELVKLNTADKIKFMRAKYLSEVLSKMLICTNCSVPVCLPIKLPEERTLKNILSEVTKSTNSLKNDSRGVGSAALIEADGISPQIFESRITGGPFVSNAGVIDDKLLDFGDGIKIEELLPYIHFNTGSPYSLAVITWKGKITLSSVDEKGSELSSSLLKETSEILKNLNQY